MTSCAGELAEVTGDATCAYSKLTWPVRLSGSGAGSSFWVCVLLVSVISCTSVLAGAGVAACAYGKLAWPGRAVASVGSGAGSSFWFCLVLVEVRVRVFCSLFDLGQEPGKVIF